MSAIMDAAIALQATMRDEFELYRHALYERAADECRGVLLNARGRAQGIDPYSLFVGPAVRVAAYGSEELVEWFKANGRVTVDEFEANWLDARGGFGEW